MRALLIALAIGWVSSAVVWTLARGVFTHPTLARRNVRGLDVPTAGGVVMLLALLPVWAVLHGLVMHTDVVSIELAGAVALLGVVAVFGMLGLVDDLLAQGDERGFRGHLGALVAGRLTTGGVKLVGGGLAALAVAVRPDLLGWLVDAAVIALAANLANLLDRAPGRLTKVAVLALVALTAGLVIADGGTSTLGVLVPVATVVGTALGLLVPELREQVMLGDTGANPLGAVLGIGAIGALGGGATSALLVVLVALNLLSERVSFSKVIARTGPLRWLDELGRPTG